MKENRVVMPSKASAARKGALGKNVVADVTLRMMEVEEGRLLDCAHLLNWALLTNRADHIPEKVSETPLLPSSGYGSEDRWGKQVHFCRLFQSAARESVQELGETPCGVWALLMSEPPRP
jgi:hypothetical protein